MKTAVAAALVAALLLAGQAIAAEPVAAEAPAPVPDLKERLACKDEPVRYQLASDIVRATGAGGGGGGGAGEGGARTPAPELRAALEKLFADPSTRVRSAATVGLGRLGDKALLPLLAKATATGDSSLLLAIVAARRALDDDAVAADLEKMLKGDVDPQGLAAARIMATIGDAEMLRVVIEAAQDPSAKVRMRAFFGLGFSRYTGTMDAIGSGLSDADAKARQVALDAVGRRRARGDAIAQSVVMIMREDDSPAVRRAAANTLGLMRAAGAVEGLKLSLQKDEDASVRSMAATSLGSIGAEEARATLLAAARREEAPVRVAAVAALSRYRAKDLLSEFISLLKDPVAPVRRGALGCIAQFPAADARDATKPLVMVLTTDPDPGCRASAAFMLPKLAPQGMLPLLFGAAGDKEPAVRVNVAFALAKTQKTGEPVDARVADALVKLLDDKAASVRGAAVQQCGRLGVKAAAEKTAALLRTDGDLTVRTRAAKALRNLGNQTVTVSALIDALADASDQVRAAAVGGLRAISGKRFAYGPWDAPSRRAKAIEAWKRWWQSKNVFPIR